MAMLHQTILAIKYNPFIYFSEVLCLSFTYKKVVEMSNFIGSGEGVLGVVEVVGPYIVFRF